MPPFEFCIPTVGAKVRLRIERNGDRVRLIARGGYDWANRYPSIVEAALKNRQKQFVIEARQ
jgi:bifunctional non-homologous end joining protein LigD